MLIVGSRAAKHYLPDFREPKDHDVICTPDEFKMFRKLNPELEKYLIFKHTKKWIMRKPKLQVEFELAIPGSSGELLLNIVNSDNCFLDLDECHPDDFIVRFHGKIYYANPEILFLIKKSHIGYQIHWDKNIADYSFLKERVKSLDFFTLILKDFMDLREKEMKERFSKRKKIDMDKKNSDFFNYTQKSIKRKYPHDLLHKHTCYYDEPLYLKLKVDKEIAKVDENLWNNLSFDDKVKAVREEAMVIALERKIIPTLDSKEKIDRIEAFKWALMRISTNLTEGFFREFAVDNHLEILKDIPAYDSMFFTKMHLAI
jgi:hypothetical protein